MIPNFFMRLEAMPMTPSGKMDRKNLPTPVFTRQTSEYVSPVTEKEKTLCRLLEELLHMERIGVQDDFFDNGGDSLTAIEYTAKAHSLGIDFSLQNVFDYPTVYLLCDFLEKGKPSKVNYRVADFDKYKKLFEKNIIEESFVPEKKTLGNILLTGATGFLGAHVLDELMREEAGKIYLNYSWNTNRSPNVKSTVLCYNFTGTLSLFYLKKGQTIPLDIFNKFSRLSKCICSHQHSFGCNP